MTAEIRSGVVVATEHIKAAPEVVFPYFTDPELLVQWLGERAELDPRPGGLLSLDMGSVIAAGTYLTVEPPHRVTFTWGVPGNEELPPGGSTVEVVLTPAGEDTVVVLTHTGLPAGQLDIHRAGWEDRLGRLLVTAG